MTIEHSKDGLLDRTDCLEDELDDKSWAEDKIGKNSIFYLKSQQNNEHCFTLFWDNGEVITGDTMDLGGNCVICSTNYEVYEEIPWSKVDYLYKRSNNDVRLGHIENLFRSYL